jgi:hypothetical protein
MNKKQIDLLDGEGYQIRKINNPKYFDPFLQTLRDNTNINNHNENYSLIVENFGKLDQKIDMREIVKIVDKKRHIPHMVLLARNYMVKDILNNMDNKQLANKIRGCL